MNLTKINLENNCKINYEIGEGILIENGLMSVNRSPYKLRFPLELDTDLAYLAGYHLGDGYLEDVKKTFARRAKAGYEILYADNNLDQINIISDIINNKFGFKLDIYKKSNENLWIGRAASCKVLHWFLNTKLNLPIGRRDKIEIPKWVLDKREFLANFMSGFFDADGDVSNTSNHSYKIVRIQLTQKYKEILLLFKKLLYFNFNIKSNISKKWKQNAWMLHIWGKNNSTIFKYEIGFRNNIKRHKLEEYLETSKPFSY